MLRIARTLQKEEITEHHIYTALSSSVKDSHNRDVCSGWPGKCTNITRYEGGIRKRPSALIKGKSAFIIFFRGCSA
jgi:hypothetical protein